MEILEVFIPLGMLLFIGACKLKWILEDLNYYEEQARQYQGYYHNLLLRREDGDK